MWGQHLALDLYGCNPERLKCPDTIKTWCMLLVEKIGMQAYGNPILEHFATHNNHTGGYTLLQLIETSNIAAHFAENIGEMYLDVFSCMEFNPQVAINLTTDVFEATSYERHDLKRGLKTNVYHIVNPVVRDLCGSMGKVA